MDWRLRKVAATGSFAEFSATAVGTTTRHGAFVSTDAALAQDRADLVVRMSITERGEHFILEKSFRAAR